MEVETWPLEKIKPYPGNPRRNDKAVKTVANSIQEFGFRQPIVVDKDGVIIVGHTRFKAAKRLELKEVPVHVAGDLTELQVRALRLADNKTGEIATWDNRLLPDELTALLDDSFDIESIGFSLEEIAKLNESNKEGKHRTLTERFLVPPFSILDARQGYWHSRKEEWLNLGLESDLGRLEDGKGACLSKSSQPVHVYKIKNAYEEKEGRIVSWEEFYAENPDVYFKTGTSIFDPVLAELCYRWFCPKGGTTLDPFAGGSVRGIVASRLGRKYVGIELRPEQIEANQLQAEKICTDPMPEWIEGDSREIEDLIPEIKADFLFTCPPYADLERYSDDPRDLSTLEYNDFIKEYTEIIKLSCDKLKENRFACFVVGDLRDKDGFYRNFHMHTIQAFEAAGLKLYNDAILIMSSPSLPMRVKRYFTSSRKLGKAHQNVQVFFKGGLKAFQNDFKLNKHHENLMLFSKGDPKEATEKIGEIDVSMETE